jgi:hypothetical protein
LPLPPETTDKRAATSVEELEERVNAKFHSQFQLLMTAISELKSSIIADLKKC